MLHRVLGRIGGGMRISGWDGSKYVGPPCSAGSRPRSKHMSLDSVLNTCVGPSHKEETRNSTSLQRERACSRCSDVAVSYTHLTLPTILLV
eukprot:3337098-Pyramimonas_sp.AAC.1